MNPMMPRLRYEIGSIVCPGDRIGVSRQQIAPGPGTYQRAGHIYSSLVGRLEVRSSAEVVDTDNDDKNKGEQVSESPMFICSVVPAATKNDASSQVLKVGQRVVGKVIRLSPQNAIIELHIVEGFGRLMPSTTNTSTNNNANIWEGTIRREDIRSGATDQILMSNCFRVGDWILARIVSLGTESRKSYMLSTAEPELGVIRATATRAKTSSSIQQQQQTTMTTMIPISWKEMQCPITGIKEPRKCARPPNSNKE